MDGGIIKLLAPQLPSLANTTLWHTLGMTQTSAKWDLRTALTVQVLRSIMTSGANKPTPVGKVQATTLKDPGIKGKIWVAKATIKAPTEVEEDIRHAVFDAIDTMAEVKVEYTRPNLTDMEVEWTGFRPSADKNDPLPSVSEEEKYRLLMAEPTRTSDTTILYFHGGAYYLCDPSTHRAITSRLAKEAHGRVCSVRYRLAPQAAFPAQLLDALMVYLSLLHPPPGSLHEPIPASKIVFAGDSAGGNLSFALLQLLLQLHRQIPSPTLLFHGVRVPCPLPAAATAAAGWFDISRALPSITSNAQYDYLPPPQHDSDASARFPADSIWPADPPRGDLFCSLHLLDHPLVSPVLARDWSGAPPLYFNTGQEMLTDEIKVVAARAAGQGVRVVFEEYEAMPHCFAMLLPGLEASGRCVRGWGEFCHSAVEEAGGAGKEMIETKGTWVEAKTGREVSVDVQGLSEGLEFEEVVRLVREAKRRRLLGWAGEGVMNPKPAL